MKYGRVGWALAALLAASMTAQAAWGRGGDGQHICGGRVSVATSAVRPPQPGEVTLASQNLWRLYDDQGAGQQQESPVRYRERLDLAARHIHEQLQLPDVLAVQEVENLRVLTDLARALEQRAPGSGYRPVLVEGYDPSGIDVGFLVGGRVAVKAQQTVLAEERQGRRHLFDRPPLQLRVRLPGAKQDLVLLAVHLKSMLGSDRPGGDKVQRKRYAQAESLARWLGAFQRQEPQTPLLLLGDFNAQPGGDGVVDVLAMLRGVRPTAGYEYDDQVDPDLIDLGEQIFDGSPRPAAERWSYLHRCQPNALDHALASASLLPQLRDMMYARGSAAWNRRQPERDRVSDHDGFVVYLRPR